MEELKKIIDSLDLFDTQEEVNVDSLVGKKILYFFDPRVIDLDQFDDFNENEMGLFVCDDGSLYGMLYDYEIQEGEFAITSCLVTGDFINQSIIKVSEKETKKTKTFVFKTKKGSLKIKWENSLNDVEEDYEYSSPDPFFMYYGNFNKEFNTYFRKLKMENI